MHGFKFACERLLQTTFQNKDNIPPEMLEIIKKDLLDLLKQIQYMKEGEREL